MNILGNMLTSGDGGPKNASEARSWYEKSAEKGNEWGMFNLGYVLFQEKNYSGARTWLQRSADKNLPQAWGWLGLLYDYNASGFSNPPLAAQYVFRALKAGNAFTLESMTRYHHGRTRQFRRELQKKLKQAGLYTGRIDGSFGPSTIRAIRALARGQQDDVPRFGGVVPQ